MHGDGGQDGAFCDEGDARIQGTGRNQAFWVQEALLRVCGGLAEYYGISPFRVRVIYVLVSAVSVAFPGILVYLALWFLIPNNESLY